MDFYKTPASVEAFDDIEDKIDDVHDTAEAARNWAIGTLSAVIVLAMVIVVVSLYAVNSIRTEANTVTNRFGNTIGSEVGRNLASGFVDMASKAFNVGPNKNPPSPPQRKRPKKVNTRRPR